MHPAGSTSGSGRPDERFDRPRFRQDLFAELVDEQGGRFIDVMDPDSGNLFRFYEVEYSLACGMDGERDIPGIVKWAQEELGLTPSQQEVRSIIATLQDLGFIDSGAQAQQAADLAPGVVVGAPLKTPVPAAAGKLDLGMAGGAASKRTPPVTPAPEFALGAPGGAARRSAEPVEDVALGAPGRGPARPTPAGPSLAASPPADSSAEDMSLDLSDHIAVGRADVQEAVRASRVMAAVDVPQSVLDAIEDRPTSPAASPGFDTPSQGVRIPEPRREPHLQAPAAPPVPAPRELRDPRADLKPVEARVGKPPLTRAPSGPHKPPVELPRPPVPSEHLAATPAPRAGVSRALIGVLILAAIAAAAYFVSRYVFGKPDAAEPSAEQAPAPAPPPPAPPPPPPPPPPVTSKVAMETPPVDEVKADRAGVIETILADKSAVKAGDVIAKLVGDKPIEAELANIGRDVKRLQDQIDAATAKLTAAQTGGNKAGETAATAQLDTLKKSLATKHDAQATKTTDLDKFLMHAPNAGTFTPAVKLGKKIAASDVVATIQRDPKPVATFKVTDAKPFAANASVELGVGTGEQRVVCTVAEVSEGSLKVACPADPLLAEGADVTLKTTMAKPETPPPPPATDSPAPSAAPPAAAPGTAPAPMPTTAPAAPAPPSPSPGP